jgi:hypothetical protein
VKKNHSGLLQAMLAHSNSSNKRCSSLQTSAEIDTFILFAFTLSAVQKAIHSEGGGPIAQRRAAAFGR